MTDKDNCSREVNNKDIPVLCRIPFIQQEIEQTEGLMSWERERTLSLSQHLTGMPRSGNTVNRIETGMAILSDLESRHKEQCRDYVYQMREAQKIIQRIESPTMRTFVKLKYVFGLPDTEIRKRLYLTRRGFERARKWVEEAPSMSTVPWKDRFVLTEEGRQGE